jgi:putative protease
MIRLELLAPAKNLECGIAAVEHGADAVYIGAPRFGARAAVGNSVDDIRQLCDYAHRYGARVYVTVNTIVYDDELEDTRLLLAELRQSGVDAVLVQDMAVMQLCKEAGLPVHASTQTDNRTAEKVRWLSSIGFSRVVLARELSAAEIAAIHREVPGVELEAFVHGALCVSYSGVCYASQYCFGRSANRGECAQFCRMKFDLVDSGGSVIERGRYLLSLKDLNQYDQLEQLVQAGAVSFKIEGRLKDVVYVKNVTAAYSERINEIIRRNPGKYSRASWGNVRYTFTPNLKKTFNRGYTSYFLEGRQPGIASFDTPKALGEFVGTVKEIRGASFTVAGVSAFANGDGLCFLNADRELEGFRVNRVEGNRLFPLKMPQCLHPGMALYRNNDQEFERLLSKASAERKIPITMRLTAVDGGFALEAGIDGQCTSVATVAFEHQKAAKPQQENIIKQLTKLGGTPYECDMVEIPAGFEYFIPSSLLAELRRKAVEGLKAHPAPQPGRARGAVAYVPMDEYRRYPYLYNVSNDMARKFYASQHAGSLPAAFEVQPASNPLLMQCRHCLRYSLGYCVKHGGRQPSWREPLFLSLADGRRFRIQFDCNHCQMNIYAE